MRHFQNWSIPLIILLTVAVSPLPAQEGHYWSENYGNKSVLLNGTVNASVTDLGTVFYNPGRLGQIENPAFVINAKAYEWSSIKVEDGVREGIDLNKSRFGGIPSLVAGTFKLPFLKNHRFAYSFLTRQRQEIDFFVRVEDEGDLIDKIPGNEIFNGKLGFRNNFTEEWIGLTWSYPITNSISLGLSNFISSISKSNNLSLDMRALSEENRVSALTVDREYSYNNYGMIWKMGMAVDLSPIRLGITVTTPRISVMGNGSALYEDYLIGIDTSGDSSIDDAFIYNLQKDLETKYKSPWAVGLGIGIHFKKAVLHVSTEWFSKVPRYVIMQTNHFIGQSSGDTLSFVLIDELDPIVNFGIGLEYPISEKIGVYASFASNYSAVTSNITRFVDLEEKANNSTLEADFYKFGGGVSIDTKAVEITVGLTYSGSDQEFNRPVDFPDEGEDSVFDSEEKSVIRINQWRFILGFSFPFADKMKKNLE